MGLEAASFVMKSKCDSVREDIKSFDTCLEMMHMLRPNEEDSSRLTQSCLENGV